MGHAGCLRFVARLIPRTPLSWIPCRERDSRDTLTCRLNGSRRMPRLRHLIPGDDRLVGRTGLPLAEPGVDRRAPAPANTRPEPPPGPLTPPRPPPPPPPPTR